METHKIIIKFDTGDKVPNRAIYLCSKDDEHWFLIPVKEAEE